MRTIVILILCAGLIIINLSDQANGFKKKKVLKKIKDALPLMLALKPRKKILLLPIPFPMKGKGKLGGNYLSALRNIGPDFMGGLMGFGSNSNWGSDSNVDSSAGYMMVPAPIQAAPPPPPPPPQPIKYMMVPMPMPEFSPPPQQIVMKPAAPIIHHHQPAYSPIDQLNNQMMNQAMDTWMMMAAMDCFGMDNQLHSHGEVKPNIVSDKIIFKEPSKQSFYRSPAQIVRETPSKTAPPPPPPPAPEPVVQAPVIQQTYHHYEPIQRPVTQNDDSSFDHEPEPIKGNRLREYPTPRPQPVQQQQQNHGGQAYFPTSDFGTDNRFETKSNQAPIKVG